MIKSNLREFIDYRNSEIYMAFMVGDCYKKLCYDYDLSESSVKRILMAYRKRNGLPNGRKTIV